MTAYSTVIVHTSTFCFRSDKGTHHFDLFFIHISLFVYNRRKSYVRAKTVAKVKSTYTVKITEVPTLDVFCISIFEYISSFALVIVNESYARRKPFMHFI